VNLSGDSDARVNQAIASLDFLPMLSWVLSQSDPVQQHELVNYIVWLMGNLYLDLPEAILQHTCLIDFLSKLQGFSLPSNILTIAHWIVYIILNENNRDLLSSDVVSSSP
jgi:hypothetical protein